MATKRYHSRGLRRLGDGRRARREAQVLRHLARAGVAVPELFAVVRDGGTWRLETELVADARTLTTLLDEPQLSRAAATDLAVRIGQLVASVALAGVEHRDLHAGNVLVDANDAPVLIDFARARRHGALNVAALERDVVDLVAAARERTPRALRRRALLALVAALPESQRERARALLTTVEERARRRRRDVVLRHLGRWTRESGVVERLEDGTLAARAGAGVLSARHAGTRSDLERVWTLAARLTEHHVPTQRPLRLHHDAIEVGAARPTKSIDAAELQRLAARLTDRGLTPSRPLRETDLVRLADDTLALSPLAALDGLVLESTRRRAT